MATILLLYSSVYGQSRRICERIAARLGERGERATVAALTDPALDPSAFDAIVVGASIKHGKHHPTVLEYLRRHRAVLNPGPARCSRSTWWRASPPRTPRRPIRT